MMNAKRMGLFVTAIVVAGVFVAGMTLAPVAPLGIAAVERVAIEKGKGDYVEAINSRPEVPEGGKAVTVTMTMEQLVYIIGEAQRTNAIMAIEMNDRGMSAVENVVTAERLADSVESTAATIGLLAFVGMLGMVVFVVAKAGRGQAG